MGSWKSPNGVVNQIDHVLVNNGHASSNIDVRTKLWLRSFYGQSKIR